ncbi:S1 family peptidase [Burkholderia contaminans]|uniref:Trypsin-like protease n=1 Tax=Burkholderia contaminans TaxID=488447 RepID=A0A6P3AFA2_9BURK|nr:trypsin-like serine protease [Burkholderia contaminans]VWD42646.1 Trypsin-like protease [Burkholderia contaminans]
MSARRIIPAVCIGLTISSATNTCRADDDKVIVQTPIVGQGFVDAQQKAASAANAYASTLAKKGTPTYTTELRKALALAYPTSVLSSPKAMSEISSYLRNNSKDFSEANAQQLHSSIVDIVGGTPVDDGEQPLPARLPTGTKTDSDPRFARNVLVLLNESRDRVYGGLPTKQFPNTVALTGKGLCTGVVVGKSAVLTAQHCICDGATESVFVGSDTLGNGDEYRVKSTAVMKACGSPQATIADVGLVFMERDFPDRIEPARIAPPAEIDNATTLRAVGFGRTEDNVSGRKMMVDLPVASPNCTGVVQRPSGPASDTSYYGCNAHFELVAGRPLLGKDTCNGDSGGPLFVESKDTITGTETFILAAITSRAVETPGMATCGDGGIYVRVDGDIRSWINTQLKSTTAGTR